MATKFQDGSGEKLLAYMKKTPTKLFTPKMAASYLKKDYRAGVNCLYNLWRFQPGRVYRHIEKSDDGEFQYAVSISEDKRLIYKPSQKRKSPTEEIRGLFSEATNALIELEEKTVTLIEELLDEQQKNAEVLKLAEKLKKL